MARKANKNTDSESIEIRETATVSEVLELGEHLHTRNYGSEEYTWNSGIYLGKKNVMVMTDHGPKIIKLDKFSDDSCIVVVKHPNSVYTPKEKVRRAREFMKKSLNNPVSWTMREWVVEVVEGSTVIESNKNHQMGMVIEYLNSMYKHLKDDSNHISPTSLIKKILSGD